MAHTENVQADIRVPESFDKRPRLSDEALREIRTIRDGYPSARSALLPALYVAEREMGWLSPDAMVAVADALELSPATVRGVATFYSMYKHRPLGRHLIQLCTNVSCMILGAETLLDHVRKTFNVEVGGTSPDGRFSLIIMECIGACGTAPAMMVDDDFHENLTAEGIIRILERYE